MVNKKRKNVPTLQEVLDRPICYYCERDFEDLAFLIDHQKVKHFRCDRCGRRLNTIGGLKVHMSQVHKETVEEVANALPDRRKPDLEIFGMEGFPEALLEKYKQEVIQTFYKKEAEHRAATGNPPPGTKTTNSKRTETIEETKARLAEFKAKKAAAKLAAENGGAPGSGMNTPPVNTASPAPPFSQEQDFTPLGRAGSPMTPPFPVTQNVNSQYQPPYPGATPSGFPNGPPPMPGNAYMPPQPGYPPHSASYAPPQGMYGGPLAQRPAGPSPNAQPKGTPTRDDSPSLSNVVPRQSTSRQSSLPSAPGLPQRPSFDLPNVSREEMQMLHNSGPPPTPGGGPPPAGMPPHPGYPQPMPQPMYMPQPYQAPYQGPPQGFQGPPQPYQNGPPQYAMSGSPGGMPPGQWYPPTGGAPQQPPSVQEYDDLDLKIQNITGEMPVRMPQPSYAQPTSHYGYQDTAQPPQYQQQSAPSHSGVTSHGNVQNSAGVDPTTSSSSTQNPPQEVKSAVEQAEQEQSDPSLAQIENAPVNLDSLQATEAASVATPAPVSKSSKKSSKRGTAENTKMLWTDNSFSPEEKRAKKYHVSREKRTETVLSQPGGDGQEVTAPVDDVMED